MASAVPHLDLPFLLNFLDDAFATDVRPTPLAHSQPRGEAMTQRRLPRRCAVALVVAVSCFYATASRAQSLTLRRAFQSPSASLGDQFGAQAASVGESRLLMISAPGDTENGPGSGRAFLFDPKTGVVLATYAVPGPAAGNALGISGTAFGGFTGSPVSERVVLGAPSAEVVAPDDGVVHVFDASLRDILLTISHPTALPGAGFGASVVSVDPVLTDIVVGSAGGGSVYRIDATSGLVVATYADPTGVAGFGTHVLVVGDFVFVVSPNDGNGAVHMFYGPSGALQRTFSNPGIATSSFGSALLAVGNLMLVGAPEVGAGVVYVFDAATGSFLHTWTNPDAAASGKFGASLTVPPDNPSPVFVGAPESGTETGRVYAVDEVTGVVVQTLHNPDPQLPGFGAVLHALPTGLPTALLVGVPGDGVTAPGVAYLFTECGDGHLAPGEECDPGDVNYLGCCSANCELEGNGTVCSGEACVGEFSLIRRLTSPAPLPDFFGARVAPFGTDVLVSAPVDSSAAPFAGKVYRYNATTAAIMQSFTSPTAATLDFFGLTLASAGSQVAIASPYAAVNGVNGVGIVHIFDGLSGALVQTFNAPGPATVSRFGNALVAAAADFVVGVFSGGEAYVFDPTTGTPILTIPDPNGNALLGFGYAAAVQDNQLYLSSPADVFGKVFVFDRVSGDLIETIEPPDTDILNFGIAVTIVGDHVAIAAQSSSGDRVYLFGIATGTYERTIVAPDRCDVAGFGISLADSDGALLVGAPADVPGSTMRGAAYLYDVSSGDLLQAFDNPDVSSPFFGVSVTNVGGSIVISAMGGEHSAGSVWVFTACGDGAQTPGEACDDGNTAGGDGCSAHCSAETTTTTTTTTTTSSTTTTSPPGNRPPVASAGPDRAVALGTVVTLDGTASFDPDGDPIAFHWVLSVPPSSTATLIGATTSMPIFTADIAGAYQAQLIVDDPYFSSEPATVIVVATPGGPDVAITITAPADGTLLTGDHVTVEGLVQGPMNTGVEVNGVPARFANGVFVADDVPLQAGENVLVATASVTGGVAVSASATVTTDGAPAPLHLMATPAAGVAPLAVTFGFVWEPGTAITTLEIDFDGDGAFDVTTVDPATPLQFSYATPGLYRAHLRLTDDASTTADAYLTVEVEDVIAADARLKSIWSALHAALIAGDVPMALTFMSPPARSRYAGAFTVLVPQFASIVNSFSPIQGLKIGANFAEYGVTRMIAGERRLFLVNFIRCTDGVWRIDSM